MRYAELVTKTGAEVREFLAEHPGHVGAENALRTIEHNDRREAELLRIGRRQATRRDGMTRAGGRRGRCPTTRELR